MNIVFAFCVVAVTASGAEGPARDYLSDAKFVAEFRRAALDCARRKSQELKPPRLATGGTFTGYFLWDTAFCCRWAALTKPGEFPAAYSLDRLYSFAEKDGYICREYTADGEPMISADHPISFGPPILSRAELLLYRAGHTDLRRLKRVYGLLKRHHVAIQRRWRRPDGLYFSSQFGCGMDDLPRWPHGMSREEQDKDGLRVTEDMIAPRSRQAFKWFAKLGTWNRQAGWIDLTAQVALDAATLAEIGEITGAPSDEIAAFRAEREELKRLVNAKCWDEKLGFYCDVTDKGTIRRRHAGAFWVLKAELATPERAARMLETILDPKHFNTTVPVPALDRADPDYEPERSYWRGSVWAPPNLALIDGLIAYGYRKEAKDLIRRWYNAAAELYVRTGCPAWENMSPDAATRPKAERSMRDYAGWGVIPAVVLPQMAADGATAELAAPVDTASLQKAMDELSAAGGGRLVVPRGEWTIGTVWLRSGVELHLPEGAVLKGSANLDDYNAEDAYPQNFCFGSEGWSARHLIIALEVRNVAITGKGAIDGSAEAFMAVPTGKIPIGDFTWRHGYLNAKDRKNRRRPGQILAFVESQDIRISGVTLRNMPMWTCFLHGCDRVRVDGVTIRNDLRHANTDGFDIDSCDDVVVANCDIVTGDDAFAIRGMPEKLKDRGRVCENVLVTNCTCACAASGVRVGVGEGVIRNVRFRDLNIVEAGHGLLLQSCYPEARHRGVAISDISFENVTIGDSAHPIIVSAGTELAETVLERIRFRNIRAKTTGSIIVEGAGKTRPRDVLFEDVELTLVPRTGPRYEKKDWEVVGRGNVSTAAIIQEKADDIRYERVKVIRDPALGDTRRDDFDVGHSVGVSAVR